MMMFDCDCIEDNQLLMLFSNTFLFSLKYFCSKNETVISNKFYWSTVQKKEKV